MIVSSPLSPPPALDQEIALQVQLSLGMTHKNIMKDLPFREDSAVEAVQAGNMTIKAAGDRYAVPPCTLGLARVVDAQMVAIEQEAARQKEKELRDHEAQQICKHFEKLERDTNKAIE
jgi:hypothetical protein